LAHVSVKEKVPAVARVRVFVPLLSRVPLQPLPEEVQLVALTDDQVMVTEDPTAMEFADSVSVGAAGTALDVPLPLPSPPPQAANSAISRTAGGVRRALREGISPDSPIVSVFYSGPHGNPFSSD
jgi:hypothetical protein